MTTSITAAVIAAIELVSPMADSTVRVLPDVQRHVLTNETLQVRGRILQEDREGKRWLRGSSDWRKALPFVVAWRTTGKETGQWEVLLAKKPDYSDARSFMIPAAEVDPTTGRELKRGKPIETYEFTVPYANLEVATRYYLKITSNVLCGHCYRRSCTCKKRKQPSVAECAFVTEDLAPRWIAVEGRVGNFRDLGGRIGLGGRRVRQGMAYRSQGLNDNSLDGYGRVPGRNRLTVEDVKMLTGELGIRTDLDLRSKLETAWMTVSPLGERVRFVNRPSCAYKDIFGEQGKKIMAENFREFCDEANYPILFHCIGGADRTGALAYVLSGVLGVSRRELETDWESTFYPSIPDIDNANKPEHWQKEAHLTNGFAQYGDDESSWCDRIVLYLKDCGIEDAEIAKFRSIMLNLYSAVETSKSAFHP